MIKTHLVTTLIGLIKDKQVKCLGGTQDTKSFLTFNTQTSYLTKEQPRHLYSLVIT